MSDSERYSESYPAWAFWRWKLHWQILLGLVVGAAAGIATGIAAVAGGVEGNDRWEFELYDLVGDLFLNGLKLIVVPIVMASLIVSVAGVGRREGFARLGFKTLACYLTTSLIAILIGLMVVNVIQPGVADPPILDQQDTEQFAQEFSDEQKTLQDKVGTKTAISFLDTIRALIPPNVIKAAAEGELLGLIVVSLLVGYFVSRLEGPKREVMVRFWEAVYSIMLAVTDLILRFAPLGVAALIAGTLAKNYAELAADDRLTEFVQIIAWFFVTVLAALGIHFLVVLPLILAFVARVNPIRHYRAMAPALLTAFSTASSSATLPVTLDCVERRAGVSNRTSSFVLPLGATVNMDGTALYECVAAIFIAQAYGIHLSPATQFFIVLVALLTSIGVAGVPSASLVAIVIILKAVGVPMEGLALIMVVDRLLDMCRTAVNIFSDSCGAVLIATTEGEREVLGGEGVARSA